MEIPWPIVVGSAVSLVGCGVTATYLRYRFLEQPKVRVRATVKGAARFEPVVVFTLTNARKDEVHISSIQGLAKRKGVEPKQFDVSTKPNQAPSFRLPGLEKITLEAEAEDVFPERFGWNEDEENVGVDDVTELYVEDVANETRWKLSSRDVKRLRDEVREALAYRREKALWSLECRSCKATTEWRAKRPDSSGSYGYGSSETEGWTDPHFHRFTINGDALCPTCSVAKTEPKQSSETDAALPTAS